MNRNVGRELLSNIQNMTLQNIIDDNLYICRVSNDQQQSEYCFYIDYMKEDSQDRSYNKLKISYSSELCIQVRKYLNGKFVALGYDENNNVFCMWNIHRVVNDIINFRTDKFYYSTSYIQKEIGKKHKIRGYTLTIDNEKVVVMPQNMLAYCLNHIEDYFREEVIQYSNQEAITDECDIHNNDVGSVNNIDYSLCKLRLKYSAQKYIEYCSAKDLLVDVVKDAPSEIILGNKIKIGGEDLLCTAEYVLDKGKYEKYHEFYICISDSVLDVYKCIQKIIELQSLSWVIELLDSEGNVIDDATIKQYESSMVISNPPDSKYVVGVNDKCEDIDNQIDIDVCGVKSNIPPIIDVDNSKATVDENKIEKEDENACYKVKFPDGTIICDKNYINILKDVVIYAGVVMVNKLQLLVKDINLVSCYNYIDTQIDLGYGWYMMTDCTNQEIRDLIVEISNHFDLNLEVEDM